jgi:hypothetical protein
VVLAQTEADETPEVFNLNVDVVSRYVWRGLQYSASPNVQPYLSFTFGNFTIGSWASYGIAEKYAEVDLYASYSLGSFSFTVSDYFSEDEDNLKTNDYFDWRADSTTHSLEAAISWAGTEGFPLKATASVFFYGNDQSDESEPYYSSYFELGYPFKVGSFDIDVFAGATLNEGLYSDKANLVNLGFKTSRDLQITDKYALPLSASFVVNPSAQDVFFVVGITF